MNQRKRKGGIEWDLKEWGMTKSLYCLPAVSVRLHISFCLLRSYVTLVRNDSLLLICIFIFSI